MTKTRTVELRPSERVEVNDGTVVILAAQNGRVTVLVIEREREGAADETVSTPTQGERE